MDNSIVTEFARLRFKRHQSHPPPDKSAEQDDPKRQQLQQQRTLDHGEPPARRQAGGVGILGNAALDESSSGSVATFQSLAAAPGGTSGTITQQQQQQLQLQQMKVKRKAWRRRCKSTSNLANLAGEPSKMF